MTELDLEDRLTDVFRNAFDQEDLKLTRDMTSTDVEEWDSLSHVNLIVAVEKEFGVRFTTPEIAGLQNVGELMDAIQRKLR